MASVHIGLAEPVRKKVSGELTVIVSHQAVLYIKTLKFHWNVQGIGFKPFHELFKEQYEALLHIVDDMSERIRALGFMAPGTMKEYLENSTLKEKPGVNPKVELMVKELLQDHETIIQALRKAINDFAKLGDEGTSNFVTDIMEKHEKIAWMLRATLE